jgi:hypothetical protein
MIALPPLDSHVRKSAGALPAIATGTADPAPGRAATKIVTYFTLGELRRCLTALDGVDRLTVVLILDSSFCGHLSSLIERSPKDLNGRLILAVESGRLPGLDRIMGPTVQNGFGWQEIDLETDPVAVVHDLGARQLPGESLVVFVPMWCVEEGRFRSRVRRAAFRVDESTPNFSRLF